MSLIQYPKKEELTPKGFTNRIKIKEGKTTKDLLNYGFTNHNKSYLYFSRMVIDEISFNLIVCKETLEIKSIDVLDEDFLQPYDYQREILLGNPSQFALETFHNVNEILHGLQSDGIITGYIKGMYI